MRNNLLLALVILATIIQACGSDRQLDSNLADQSVDQPIDGSDLGSATQEIDALMLNGLKFGTPFILDLAFSVAELVYMEAGSTLEASLRADGFDGPLASLAITLEHGDASPNVLLHIRKDGIFDGSSNMLVDQVPAKYGYAWRVGVSSSDALLSRRSFVSVVLLDENGAGISDELYIYWKATSDTEGRFVVTNIPNEII